MNKGALALLVHGGTENWSPERWKAPIRRGLRRPPRAAVAGRSVRPRRGSLCRGLEAAAGRTRRFSESARHLQPRRRRRRADGGSIAAGRAAGARRRRRPHRPHDGICRAPCADASSAGALFAGESSAKNAGRRNISGPASAISVGIMGLGTLGARCGRGAAAARLSRRRLEPQPEDRSTASNAFTAQAQLEAFLRRTDILVCLLPLTPDTRHILNRDLFTKLNRSSPMGAPVLINAGRGGLQNEADILPASTTARSAPPRSTSTRRSRCPPTARSGPIQKSC